MKSDIKMIVGSVAYVLSLFALVLGIAGFASWGSGIYFLSIGASIVGVGCGIAMMLDDRNEKRHI